MHVSFRLQYNAFFLEKSNSLFYWAAFSCRLRFGGIWGCLKLSGMTHWPEGKVDLQISRMFTFRSDWPHIFRLVASRRKGMSQAVAINDKRPNPFDSALISLK